MAAGTMASLPPPPTMTTATLALIALTLPWTRIGQWGGGCTMTCLICRCHGLPCWRHLCLHLREDNAKDDGRGDRRGCHANIRSQKEAEHHDPISVEQQKQKQKQQQNKNKNKSKSKDKKKAKAKTKTKTKSTTVAATSPPLHLQTATPMQPPLLPLHKQRQQWRQHGGSGGISRPDERIICSAPAESIILPAPSLHPQSPPKVIA
jgi:hypothetical protein